MTLLPPFWRLVGFEDRFTAWFDQEQPDDELCHTVGDWIASRGSDPYDGARRELDVLPDLWGCILGDTARDGRVVYCTFRIIEDQRIVKCNGLMTLSLPII